MDRETNVILGRKYLKDDTKRIGIDYIRAHAFALSILEARQWEEYAHSIPGCRRKSFRITNTWKDFLVEFETCVCCDEVIRIDLNPIYSTFIQFVITNNHKYVYLLHSESTKVQLDTVLDEIYAPTFALKFATAVLERTGVTRRLHHYPPESII